MILRTQLCLFLLLLASGVLGQDEDYGGDMGGSSSSGNNDEIFDPAQLEIEVEAEMQQHRNNLEADEHTEIPMDQEMASTLRPTESQMSTMATFSEENTASEMMDEAPSQNRGNKVTPEAKNSRDYYDEDSSEDEMMTSTTARVATTMIPEYVRQAKAERFPQKDTEHQINEYVDEVVTKGISEEQPTDMTYHVESHPPQPQAQVQQLPLQGKSQTFKYAADDEYYDDQIEAKPQPTITTQQQAALPVLRARFGGFPWPSSTQAPATMTTITSTVSTSTTTSSSLPRKQAKHIHELKPELLPADQLRNYIKDVYIRMPLAVIVDPSSDCLEQAKRLYIDALQDKNIDIKIVLVTLNGAGAPSTFSFNNTREFIAGLNSTKEHEGGNSFEGVLHAAELVPYDSAVFISTATIPPHTELVQDAAITLLKKRIRLFLLWYGDRSGSENETEDAVGGILGEVATRSGGEIIHIVSSEHGQHIAGNTLTLVADAYQGVQELELPVDTTLSSLHVRIDANMRRAAMETPNGG